MLNQKDLDNLRWIAQRLVNRYREDPQILLVVDDIINKIVAEISAYKTYNSFILKSITPYINTLQEIVKYTHTLPSVIKEDTTQLTINKNTDTFENINISEILK